MNLTSIKKEVARLKKLKKNKDIYMVYSSCPCGEASCYHYLKYEGHTRGGVFLKDINGITTEFRSRDLFTIRSMELQAPNFSKKYFGTIRTKGPKNGADHVGVELEFISKLNQLEMVKLIIENDLDKHVTVKDDGSVNEETPYNNSFELNIVAGKKAIYKVIKKLCKLLEKNSKVNASCGLHVHLDMRNRSADNAYANLFSCQPMFYKMVDNRRYTGNYCKPVDRHSPPSAYHGERMSCINKCALEQHQTLEVRVHDGSLDATVICNWVRLLNTIVDAPPVMPRLINNLSEIKTVFSFDNKLSEYIVKACKVQNNIGGFLFNFEEQNIQQAA